MIFRAHLFAQALDLNAFGGGESFGTTLDLVGQWQRPLGMSLYAIPYLRKYCSMPPAKQMLGSVPWSISRS